MTKPRRHLPDQTVMLTRRTVARQFLLRPDKEMNHIIEFETAKASARHGLEVHGAVGMSNHVHFVATDTTGDRSCFMRDAMSGIARARNNYIGRKGYVWGAGQYSDVLLPDENSLQRKLLYTWLNPVRAGLVEQVEDWPGFMILPKHWGKTITVKCPDSFYGRNSPDEVTFTPKPPPGFEDWELEKAREHFEELIRKEEERIHNEHPDRRYKGAQRVKADDLYDSPEGQPDDGRLNPTFATKDPELRELLLKRHRTFQDDYQTMRQRWLKGQQVTFPSGTVQLPKQAPVEAHEVDDDEPGRLGILRKDTG